MEKIEKFSIQQVYEETVQIGNRGSKVGQWVDDELIVSTYPMLDIVNRIIEIGYDLTKKKAIETKLKKTLAAIIKKDRAYTMATIDILNDPDITSSEKADMIDANVDGFVADHAAELKQFVTYRRRQ